MNELDYIEMFCLFLYIYKHKINWYMYWRIKFYLLILSNFLD